MTTLLDQFIEQKRKLECDLKDAILEVLDKHRDSLGGVPTSIEVEIKNVYQIGKREPYTGIISDVRTSFDL
jgi:hypothetical protein